MAAKTDLSTLERMAKDAEPGVLASAVLELVGRLRDAEAVQAATIKRIESGIDKEREAKADEAAWKARAEESEDELSLLRHLTDVRMVNYVHEKLLNDIREIIVSERQMQDA